MGLRASLAGAKGRPRQAVGKRFDARLRPDESDLARCLKTAAGMSYRDLDTETLKRRIAELVELRADLDAQLAVLTGARGRRTPTWFPKLVFGVLAAVVVFVSAGIRMLPRVGNDGRVRATRDRVTSMLFAAKFYRSDRAASGEPDHCPSARDLRSEHYLNRDISVRDGWGHDFRIRCAVELGRVHVTSAGPDGLFDTLDDLEDDIE